MPLSVKDCVAKFDEKKVERKNWTGHSAKVHSVAWNKDGTRLASGSADKTTRVWEVTNDSKYSSGNSQQLTGHTGPVDQLCWDPTGTTQLASASSDKTVRVWDLRQSATPCVTVSTVGENINIAWSPDGNYIAVGNKEDVLTMIDARKFKAIRVQRFNHEVNEFAWDNSGKYLFMTTELGTVEICSHELKRIKAIQAHPSNIYCIEFDKSNRYFAVGSADAIVSLFTLPEMICVRTFTKLEYAVRTISFSHDSSMLTSASEEPLIDISHVQTGDSVHQLDGNAPINAVAWSPRDHILAYAGDEKDRYNDAGNVRLLRCAA
nr:THO complex subunit 3 [Euglena gracilis]|eukprot:EG_transcript_15487